jgi:hypothetical protein
MPPAAFDRGGPFRYWIANRTGAIMGFLPGITLFPER